MTVLSALSALIGIGVFVGYIAADRFLGRRLTLALAAGPAFRNRQLFWAYTHISVHGPAFLVHELAHAAPICLFGGKPRVRLDAQHTEDGALVIGQLTWPVHALGLASLVCATAPLFVGLSLFVIVAGTDFSSWGNPFLMAALAKPLAMAVAFRSAWLSGPDLEAARVSLPGALATALMTIGLVAALYHGGAALVASPGAPVRPMTDADIETSAQTNLRTVGGPRTDAKSDAKASAGLAADGAAASTDKPERAPAAASHASGTGQR